MTNILIDFISIDEMWDKQIQQYAFDVYHLSGWLHASAVIDQGECKGIIAKYNSKEMFIPILMRKIHDKYWDASSPYGYSGPVMDDSLTDEEITLILEHIKVFLYDKGCVSWFLRLHPIINKDRHSLIGSTVTHGPVLIADLTQPKEIIWQQTSGWHKKDIKKALKHNVDVKIEKLNDNNIKVFSSLYKENMVTVGADKYYFFDDDYFYSLSHNLSDRLLLIKACHAGTTISALICTLCKETGIINSHLIGTRNAYRRLNPSKLIFHTTRMWGKDNGYKTLNLGGGVGAKRDSLYSYKKGFSSEELLFRTYRMIINPKIYSKLVNDINTLDNKDENFFPLYRI